MMAVNVEESFRTHRARVYRWARSMHVRHNEALDIVQEVFLRMLRAAPVLSDARATTAWLRRVTSRIVIDRWRSAAARRESSAPSGQTISDESPETRETRRRVRAAIASLSDRQRLVLMSKCYDQMTFREIAAELGISVPTAKTHYLRGLSAVRDRLGNAFSEETQR